CPRPSLPPLLASRLSQLSPLITSLAAAQIFCQRRAPPSQIQSKRSLPPAQISSKRRRPASPYPSCRASSVLASP
uniref:Uncharacterized protein n=1 Tax=Aegilops tauschii subsp. strangulata TaxID=200361 RepID=A0A453MXH2_AEGTS